MHLPPLCRVLGIHCLSKMFSLLVVQAIKGFSWKIRKPLFIISAVRKEQCYWEALLLHFLVKARPLKWCSCWYGGGLPTVSSVTACWSHLSCGQGMCAAQQKPKGHAGLAAHRWPGPVQANCCVDHKFLGASWASVRITTDVKVQ